VLSAQSAAILSGTVVDPNDRAVQDARVTLSHALSGFQRETHTQADGSFSLANLPYQSYVLAVSKDGFAEERQTVVLRSNVPVSIAVRLGISEHSESLSVSAFGAAALVEPETTGTRTELTASIIERMPTSIGARGLESVLLSFPGFAADANGAIHPRGAHNQMTYVVDGMPISDQLTGAFANAIDPNIVQTIELYTGNIPAEFGSKISGVANITTISGLGSGRRFSGNTQWSAAQFDTLSQVTQLSGDVGRFGYVASFTTLKSHRYLDQVSLDNLHNGGNSERGFGRVDYQASPRDSLRLNVFLGRSSFELANLRSQQAAGQRQRQLLRDFSASLGWVHSLSPRATLDSTTSYRATIAQLFPSPADTPVTAAQARHLSTFTEAARFSVIVGRHTIRTGADCQHFPVSENFTFGITEPSFNDPRSPGFIPTLMAYDLSRGGGLFQFSKQKSGNLVSSFVQDQAQWGRFAFSLGLRYDDYRFLVNGHQLQPRLGVSYHLRETGTVVRASYNRVYQTPVNENLLLSNSSESAVLVPASVRARLGGAILAIRPERQNVFEVGLQQGIFSRASVNAVYYYKDERDLHDNDNFFNTGIIFPTSLKKSRVNGAELRVTLLPAHGLSGSLSLTHYHVVVTPPFTGGLFIGQSAILALSSGPFIIDHDQQLGAQANLQYALSAHIWTSWAVRYDSGLVTNPSDPAVVRKELDYADLLPYVNLGANPPRVRPRTIVDFAVGYEKVAEGRRRWDFQFQISNLTDRTALYNFQSIFVGTRLVQPRSLGLKFRRYW